MTLILQVPLHIITVWGCCVEGEQQCAMGLHIVCLDSLGVL